MNFYEIIKSICKNKKNITLTEMVKELELSTSMPTNWKKGLIPNGETLVKLADYLDVSIDTLLGRDQRKKERIAAYGGSTVIELPSDISNDDLKLIEFILSKYN